MLNLMDETIDINSAGSTGDTAIELTYPKLLEMRLYLISTFLIAGTLVVPFIFHQFGISGQIIMPLYFFALLAGLVYGWQCGLFVGIIAPIISFSFTQMPLLPLLPFIILKSAMLGGISGFIIENSRTKKTFLTAVIAIIFSLMIGNLLLYISTNNPKTTLLDLTVGFPGLILLILAVPYLSNKIISYERKIVRRYNKQNPEA